MMQRLAATGALVALVAAAAAAVLALSNGAAWSILVVVVSITATIIGLWYLVARRGPARVAGGSIAVAGAVSVLITVLRAPYHGVLLVAAFALVAVSAAAASYALAKTRGPAAASTIGVPVSPPRSPVLIMNPKSGGGKVERFRLVEECRQRGIEPIVLRLGDDLRQLAEDAINSGGDAIGMAGGDGSQALVAAVAAEKGIPYVCIPAGTRNHFALDLGLDRDDVVGALDAFTDALERRVDLAFVNDRVFVNNASMGLYAKIVQSPEYRDAKIESAAEMLPAMLGPDAEPFDLRFADADGVVYPTAHLILVSNNPYQLDHLGGRGTREHLDGGVLGIAAARIADAGEAVAFVGLEAAGRIRGFPGWHEWEAPRFRVDSSGPIEIGIDGEALRLDPPLVFETHPNALRVLLPKSAGLAPAALRLPAPRALIPELVRVLAGHPPGASAAVQARS
jgi:diacylglycerol kinase family enzyme